MFDLARFLKPVSKLIFVVSRQFRIRFIEKYEEKKNSLRSAKTLWKQIHVNKQKTTKIYFGIVLLFCEPTHKPKPETGSVWQNKHE